MTFYADQLTAIVDEVLRLRHLHSGDPLRVWYRFLFKAVYFPGDPEVKDSVASNRLVALLGDLLSDLQRRVGTKPTDSGSVLIEALGQAERVASHSSRIHVLLCDALSIPECLSLFLEQNYVVKCFFHAANPSGKTATFKYLARHYLKIPPPRGEDLVMRTVAKGLAEKIGASSHQCFRKIDNTIHWGPGSKNGFGTLDDVVGTLLDVVEDLRQSVAKLAGYGSSVLLLADHAYDVTWNGNRYLLSHGWKVGRKCVSPFAPIMVLG